MFIFDSLQVYIVGKTRHHKEITVSKRYFTKIFCSTVLLAFSFRMEYTY